MAYENGLLSGKPDIQKFHLPTFQVVTFNPLTPCLRRLHNLYESSLISIYSCKTPPPPRAQTSLFMPQLWLNGKK